MKTVKTLKGTELPLTNLKGRDYLMIAYRLQWLSEDIERYDISTDLVQINDEQTIARATVVLYNKEGHVVRRAQATKRETKKDFPDHTEKAETAAIGRALAMLGFGTQHALSDLDEGHRLADSPLQAVERPKALIADTATTQQLEVPVAEVPKARTSFRKFVADKPVMPSTLIEETSKAQDKRLNF